MNKRGQGLSVNAIILIVLGVLILVFLIIGFSIGWKKILPWIKPGNNVDDIKQQCELACNSNSKYNFCTLKRDLFAEDDVELKDVNCNILAVIYTKYGIGECPSIKCDVKISDSKEDALKWCDDTMANQNDAQRQITCKKIVLYEEDNKLISSTCKDVGARPDSCT